MDDIKQRLQSVKDEIKKTAIKCGRNPEDITLIAVSKKKSVETIIEAIFQGVEIFGENYIQEAVDKIELIRLKEKSAIWHFIGHLQSNKAKVAVKYFDLIHTVHSLKLAQEINRQAEKIGKIQNILIQINISQEGRKSGVKIENGVDDVGGLDCVDGLGGLDGLDGLDGVKLANIIKLVNDISHLKSVSLRGLMGMPPFFDEPERARPYFRKLAQIRNFIKDSINRDLINQKDINQKDINQNNIDINKKSINRNFMEHLSMGMSGDFKVAIEEGSTIVRIGTAIFGNR